MLCQASTALCLVAMLLQACHVILLGLKGCSSSFGKLLAMPCIVILSQRGSESAQTGGTDLFAFAEMVKRKYPLVRGLWLIASGASKCSSSAHALFQNSIFRRWDANMAQTFLRESDSSVE